ncbi:GNAT family N-acetyltransferase [Mesorhizobium sp. M0778]|uniref:GNAT family N-acetyltransferase n=1 Tax=Mesorhizobium sp. M0778 TaxID=2956999 RepID=UPI003338DD55
MIRVLQGDDQTQWRALWAQYLDFEGTTLDAIVHDRTWTRLLDEAEPIHGALALAGGEAVGFVHYIFRRSTWSLSDSCYLQDLFVAPTARGKGYGRALIAHVCAEAANAGSSHVDWQTQAENSSAIALYEKVAERSGYIQFRKLVPS